LTQPLDPAQGRLASTTRAPGSHTVVVRIPFDRQSDRAAFAAREFASLGVEVGFKHGRDSASEVVRLLRVQRLVVSLLRPLDRVRISFSVAALLRSVPALLTTESLSLIRVLGQGSQAIEAAPFAAKIGPTFEVAVEVVLFPQLRVFTWA
jgi:hypothetical protein